MNHGLVIAVALQPPKMGGELIVATSGQNYFRVNLHEDFNAKIIGHRTSNVQQDGGCIYLSGLPEENGRIVCSRPDSVLFQTDGTNVSKSSQFKSKKIGALTFGSLHAVDSDCLLSVTDSHITLLNLKQVKVLSYENVSNARLFNYDR